MDTVTTIFNLKVEFVGMPVPVAPPANQHDDMSRLLTVLWNPDHLDKNWRNGTYVSEHAGYRHLCHDVHVYEAELHTSINMYVHGMYMYINHDIYKCTYMFTVTGMNSYLCMYIVHTHT